LERLTGHPGKPAQRTGDCIRRVGRGAGSRSTIRAKPPHTHRVGPPSVGGGLRLVAPMTPIILTALPAL